MATKGKTANAKRKVKRYSGEFGSDVDAANETDDPIAALNKSRGWTDTEEAPAKVAPKRNIVTKEELAKSGLSLRDYMNKQQGLTRRGSSAPADELTSVAKDRAAAYKKAEAEARSPEGRAERQKKIEEQAVERVYPESNFLPGASIKTLANVAKGMAARHAAQGVEKLAEYSTPILENVRKMLPSATKLLGMKKGGAVKKASKPAASSASRRADGIASKGKTKGRMV